MANDGYVKDAFLMPRTSSAWRRGSSRSDLPFTGPLLLGVGAPKGSTCGRSARTRASSAWSARSAAASGTA